MNRISRIKIFDFFSDFAPLREFGLFPAKAQSRYEKQLLKNPRNPRSSAAKLLSSRLFLVDCFFELRFELVDEAD